MNILTETAALLSAALTTDPLLLLASAVAAFDPFWTIEDEDEAEVPDPLEVGLRVARGAFPDVYAEAVEQMRQGATYAELDRLICSSISAKGIPLNSCCVDLTYHLPAGTSQTKCN